MSYNAAMHAVRWLTFAGAWLVLGGLAAAAPTPPAYPAALASARAAMAARQYRQARDDYARAAKLPGADRALCALGMADADFRLASFGAGEKECRRVAELAPTPVERAAALQLAGAIALQRAAYAQITAVSEADAARRLAPFSTGPWRKWLAQAERDVRAAMAAEPENARLHFALALCLLRAGQTGAGEQQLRIYLRQRPTGAAAPMARTYLADPDAALPGRAPAFAIVAGGAHLSPQALEGKVVLLDFWGSWCPPCRASVGSLQELWKQFGRRGDFVLLSVDSHEPAAAGRKFIATHGMIWPQYWDGDQVMEKAFRVHLFPTFILLDRRGVIRGQWSGENGWRDRSLLGDAIKALLHWQPRAVRGG